MSPRERRAESASELRPLEFLRWAWRQLTSMRTALLLLLLLAVAAVPGSFIPQRGVDASAVQRYYIDHPKLSPILEKLGAFSVFSSVWFSAIYLLLMISLIGCILPRTKVYAKALRARPPRAPRNFSRLPASAQFETTAATSDVFAAGRRVLGRARIDVVEDGDAGELRAEKGYLRELGNLVFHICIVVALVGVAIGSLWGYRGNVVVVEGEGFSNTLSQYDEFSSGSLFDADTDLEPWSLELDDVLTRFYVEGNNRGAPKLFRATGTYSEGGEDRGDFEIEVNHPLSIGGEDVFLVGQGYAPVLRITDASGKVAFDGPVPFLPSDATYTSTGVVKVPDADGDQLGFQGFFLPTAFSTDPAKPSVSVFPGALNPRIGMNLWTGDLGLDDGTSQSVYSLDTSKMTQVKDGDGNFRVDLGPGESQKLPGGGSIEFVELRQFARFQIGHTPVVWLPLFGVGVGILGLSASLLVRPRRTWIRARRDGSRTVVEVAVLDRVPRDDLPADIDDLVSRLRAELGDTPEKELS
ncbi:cytochrome c biogenesis protein ResB [Aeromicrobium sp. 636]|uniref:Cytochrome c biogenesis protein ResB n=1 Tax=Aeromicrobium senzhongii TaxID=2663859 RepID=A0A8I0EY34_9ACTN|nr:cytochrome c biogenesis protein ResB [Aeromicrobium sp. 636]MBC9227330.1 cytochrome c biogenesis protein ResB [Aeromicrobium senzhongii]MCQ3999428.1 cytochrome c biogenesis protein ResB [Aeromicrobium sp. 636]